MINFPRDVRAIMKKLTEKGYKVYAVGGCVRDALMGRETDDFDLATDARLNEIGKLFKSSVVISDVLSVVRFDLKNGSQRITAELATFRQEGEYSDFRHPDEVTFVDTFEEDYKRRDFTINAIAYDAARDELIDYCGGMEDIANRIIRTIGVPEKRFQENPIRMMRAVRFAAQSGFCIEKETFAAIQKTARLVQCAGKIQVIDEFKKILLSDYAGEGMKLLVASGLAYYMTGGALDYDDEGIIDKVMAYISCVDNMPREYELRLGLFCSCFGEEDAEKVTNALGINKRLENKIIEGIYMQDTLPCITEKYELKALLAASGDELYQYSHQLSLLLTSLYGVCRSEKAREKAMIYRSAIEKREEMLAEIAKNNEPIYIEQLAVNGRDLEYIGIEAGVRIGRILTELVDMVHRDPEKNTKNVLYAAARQINRFIDEEQV